MSDEPEGPGLRDARADDPETPDIDESGVTRPSLAERLERHVEIALPAKHNPKLAAIVEAVNGHERLYSLWVAANMTAVDRLGMTDHGPVHVRIVANSALRILRLLVAGGVTPSIVADYGLEGEDAEVVVTLAALLHDVGLSIHRPGHEEFSLFVAQPILDDLLMPLYEPAVETIIRAEILHAIISHRSGGQPLTVEGGVIRVADAVDMAQGRSRIPFKAGSTSIHSVSAAAIERVHLDKGETKPVRIRIESVPEDVQLISGTTASVVIRP